MRRYHNRGDASLCFTLTNYGTVHQKFLQFIELNIINSYILQSLKLMSAVIPTSLSTQNTTKSEDSNNLLKQLLECVQNCQKRFGGKTELATEFESCVIALCLTLECVLSHGLRSKPLETQQTSTLKQVSGIVASTLQIGNENPCEYTAISMLLN